MANRPKTRVAVIGAGNIGSAVAERLLSRGYAVTVFNRTRAKSERLHGHGAELAGDAASAIAGTDVAVCALFNGAAIREVILGGVSREVLRGRVLINVAQTTPAEIVSLGTAFAEVGARLSEVEVIAYPDDVRAGRGDYVIAGPDQDRPTWETLFLNIGARVHHVGPLGSASRAEMAFWLPFAFQTIAAAYATAAFEKERLPVSVLQAVLGMNPVLRIPGAEQAIAPMVKRVYGCDQWSVANMLSSLDVAIQYARTLGLPAQVFECIRDLYQAASRRGLGGQDHMAVHEVILDAARLETDPNP